MKHLMKKTKSKNMYELSKKVAYKKSEWHEKRAAISSSGSSESESDDYNKQTHATITSSIKANTSDSIFTKIKNKIKTETNKRGGDQKQKQKEQLLNNKLNLNAQTKLRNRNSSRSRSRYRHRHRHPIRSKIRESQSSRRRTADNKPYFYYESDSSETVPHHPSGFIKQAELYQATKKNAVQTETERDPSPSLPLAKQETQVFSTTTSKNFLQDNIFDGVILTKKLKKRSASMPQIHLLYTLDSSRNISVCHPNLKTSRWASDSNLTKISNTIPIPVPVNNLIPPSLYKLKTLAGQNLSSFLEKQGEADIKDKSVFGASTRSGTQHYDQDNVWIWKKEDETAQTPQNNNEDFNFRFPFREMNQTKRKTKAKKKKRRSKTRLRMYPRIKDEDKAGEITQQTTTGMDVYEYFNDFTRTELKTIGKTLYQKYGQKKKGRRDGRDLRIDFNPDIDPDADFKQPMLKRQSSHHVGFDVDLGTAAAAATGAVVKRQYSKIAANISKNADKSNQNINTKREGAAEYEKILDRISLEMQLPYVDKHGNAITPAFEVSRNEDYRQVLTLVASEKNIHIQNTLLNKSKLKQGRKFEAVQKQKAAGEGGETPNVGEVLLTETAITIDKNCAAHAVANSTRTRAAIGTQNHLLDPVEVERHCRVKFEMTNSGGAREIFNPTTTCIQAPAQSAFSLDDAVHVITTDDTEATSCSVLVVPVPVEVETQVSAVSTVAYSSDGSVFLTEVTSHTDSAATDREGAPRKAFAGHTQAQAQVQPQSQSPTQQPIGNDLVINPVNLETEVGNDSLLSGPLPSPNSALAHVHNRTETDAFKKMGSDYDASLTPSQKTEIIEATSSVSGASQDQLSSNTITGENRIKYGDQPKSKSQKSTLTSADSLLERNLEHHHVSYKATMPTSMSEPGNANNPGKQKFNADAVMGFNDGKYQDNEDFTLTTSGSESVKLGNINIRPESIRKMLRLQAEILSEPDKYNDPKRFDAFDLVELDYAGMEAYLKYLVFSSLRRDELERLAQKQKLRDNQEDLETRTTSNLKDTDKDSLAGLKDKYKGDNAYLSNSEYYDDDQTSLGFEASSKSFWTRVKMFFNVKLNPVTFCWKQKSVMSPNRGQRQVKPMTAAENNNKSGQGSTREEDSKHEATDSDEETSSDDDTSTTNGTYRRRKELQSQIEGRDISDSDSDSDSDESDYTKTNDTKTKDTSTELTDLNSSVASTSQLRSTSKSKSKSKILDTDEDIQAGTGPGAVDDPTLNVLKESKTVPEHVI